jgi:chromosome partitioning protein
MGSIYAIANQKGGVGKTTTAVNVAACIAEAGYPSLLIDIDPQANATVGLGHPKDTHPSVYEVLTGAATVEEAIVESTIPGLHLLPANPDLAGANVELPRQPGSETRLRDALGDVRENYKLTLLDCPPALGPLTVNALVAADRVIVPVQAEYYALEGLSQLLGSINLVKARLNPRLAVAGILLTMVDGRTRLAAEVENELRRHFGDLVFTTSVPRSVRLAEAPSHGLPAIAYDRRSSGSEAYWKVAMELVERQ